MFIEIDILPFYVCTRMRISFLEWRTPQYFSYNSAGNHRARLESAPLCVFSEIFPLILSWRNAGHLMKDLYEVAGR